MRQLQLTILFAIAAAGGASAQRPAPPPSPSSASTPPPQAAAILEQKRIRARFEQDGTSERVLTLRAKVLTEQAVRDWGQLPLNYMPDIEALTVTRVRVEKADGTVIADATGSVQDVAVPPPTAFPVFLDLRQKVIAVASLRPGDVLEIEAKWNVHTGLAGTNHWFEYSFVGEGETVLDERLELDVAADVNAIVRVRPGAPAELNGGRLEGGRKIYRWATKRESASKPDPEKKEVVLDEPPADVRLTTFQSWNDIAAWYGSLSALPPTPEVTAKAVELTKGMTTPAAKVEAIYDYVAREIRYLSLSFGLGRYKPHAPAEVLKNKYGDCKDKAALLSAMLEAVGIDSLPVLLHSERSLDEALASPAEIDHVITIVPNAEDPSRWTWMDSTTEIAPIGMLPARIRDRRVLVVGRGRHATRLVRTPADPPGPWVDTVEVRGTVDGIGTLAGSITMTLGGDSEFVARSVLRMLPAAAVKEFIGEFARRAGLVAELSDESTSDLAATRTPLEMRAKLRIPGFANWAAASSELKTLGNQTVPYASEEDRRGWSVLHFGSPARAIYRAIIDLPPGFTPQAPQPVNAAIEGFSYASRYSVEGSRLTMERTIDVHARSMPAARFGEYSVFANKVLSDYTQKVRLKVASRELPEIPTGATAGELYAAAFNAFHAGNFKAAAALWEKTTAVDPKMADAWTSLGLAHHETGEYTKAVAAFEKALALNPYDKQAYRNLATTRTRSGQFEEAAAALTKHLEINPLDVDALVELGGAQTSLERYREAAATLEKAAASGKLTSWGQTLLGEAYLLDKQTEKASAVFDRALAMDTAPAPVIWTKIAWVLADAGADPPRARALAVRTLNHAASTLQTIDIAGVNDDHITLMNSVAWSWDALALLAYNRGDLAEAERYARAAWMLAREPDMAVTLGRVYEKQDRRTDAASHYLTAYAIARHPSATIKGHVKRMVGEGSELRAMLPSAAVLALSAIKLPDTAPAGEARFAALVGSDGRIAGLKFLDGDDRLRALDKALRAIRPSVAFAPEGPARLALRLYVGCQPQFGCVVTSVLPREVLGASADIAREMLAKEPVRK